MNKNRIAKTIGFLVTGALCFIPLIFLRNIIYQFFTVKENEIDLVKDAKTAEMIINIGKGFFIILGVIFLAVGLYNLIMMFTEEEN
jgi:hypothetical protein